ncbi:MAG: hypothetical protein H7327_12895 [Herminiimonas sp.]|nr:hypothetical protein [Herminiimonas sp.]
MTAAQLLDFAKSIRSTSADQRHVWPANRHPIAGAAPSRLGGTVLDRVRANDRAGQVVNNPSSSLRHLVPKADWSKVPNPADPTCPKTLSAALLNYLAGEHAGFKVKPDEVNQRLFVHHMTNLDSQSRSDDIRTKIANFRTATLAQFPESSGWFDNPAFLMLLVMELEQRRPQPYSQGPITVAEKATSEHYVNALARKIEAIDDACAVSCSGEQALDQFATSLKLSLDRPYQRGFPIVPSEVIDNVWNNIVKHTQFIAQYWDFADSSQIVERYNNIRGPRQSALLDQTRNASTYLHANFLDTGRGMRMIASQKPIPSGANSTAEAFWLASLKENIALIVDLTTARDNAQDGQHYGPARGGRLDFNDVSVGMRSVTSVSCGELESLIVRERATGLERPVKRLNFQQWPDHEVVEPSQLIDLAKAVRAHKNSSDTFLVHCMAGVGRTGTLLSFLMAKQEFLKIELEEGHITPRVFAEVIPKAVMRGRLDRGPDFVQTKQQFQLLANALMMEMGSAVSSKS